MYKNISETMMDSSETTDLLNYNYDTSYGAASNVVLADFLQQINLEGGDICFYRVNRLSFDEDYPHREAFENILLSLDNVAFNLVYILSGDEHGIDLYIGVVKNSNKNVLVSGKKLSARDYGEIIKGAFDGNFGGSDVSRLKGTELQESVLLAGKNYENAGVIVGIPSENTRQKDGGKGFQGIDRLINSMLGAKWRLIIVAEPASKDDINVWQQEVYRIYNSVAPLAKKSVQQSENAGSSKTNSENSSKTSSANFSKNHSTGGGSNQQKENDSKNTNYQDGESHGEGKSHTFGEGRSETTSRGSTQSLTAEVINKNAQEILKYIDEELLERIKLGFGRGMFKTSIYYMADLPSTANRLKVGIMSLFQGDASSYSPLMAYSLNLENQKTMSTVGIFQNNYIACDDIPSERLALLSRPHDMKKLWLSTWLTANEVALLAGLPQKEIPGISVVEGVDFGLNVNSNGEIVLGSLIQKGRRLDNMPFTLKKDFLSKHTFIAGVTGSGKTTTCHKLLKEAGVPFLVIEPAKTEYRTLIKSKEFGECIVFTVGNEDVAPLRFNPFELVPGENLSSHIDMLKATFTSAFPMEGSMPQLLEEAMYKCYENKGWNVDSSHNDKYAQDENYLDGDEFTEKYDAFPIFSDFLAALEQVVDEKNFDKRLRDDYIGSLVSRFSNLRKGAKGRMLNTSHSIDFFGLVDKNVIIELEDLKSSEDKALIIGFILSRLSAVIRKKHKENKNYRHITLVEEAHRLLSRVEFGDSGSKKGAVETFTDLLAEVRKYGEGLIIVDQIPNKLAPEVIKNTNTKIIHKILARDDKETVGDTMLMDDKQKAFMSALETGQAIVFTEGLKKPVHIAVQSITNTNEEEISDEVVRENFNRYVKKYNLQKIYFDSQIVSRFYAEFNKNMHILTDLYMENKEFNVEAEFIHKIKSYLQIKKMSVVDEKYIFGVLAKEKSQKMVLNKGFCDRLTIFVLQCFTDDKSVDILGDIELANLMKILYENDKNLTIIKERI